MSQPPNNQHHREEEQKRQQEEQRQRDQDQQARPGSRIANPAEVYAETKVPERAKASAFMREGGGHPSGYPKLLFHPVHGGVEIADPGEESKLQPRREWFDTAELADAARTHTEAEIVRFNNQIAKMKQMEEQNLPVVRNSVQADESIRRAYPEPL